MTKTKLPQALLDLAKRLDLPILEDREILASSDIGGGVELDRWLVCHDNELYIEFVLTSDSVANLIGSTRVTDFGPIKLDAAEAMLHRWAQLQKMEEDQDEDVRQVALRVSRDLFSRLTRSARRRKAA